MEIVPRPEHFVYYVNRDHQYAHAAVRLALAKGLLVRPARCEGCDRVVPPIVVDGGRRKPHQRSALHAHHVDYNEPLKVQWLCDNVRADPTYNCHGKAYHQGAIVHVRGERGEWEFYEALRVWCRS
jgi:hypothetical protein